MLLYNVDVPMQRLPIANWLLIVATCVVSTILLLDLRRAKEEYNLKRWDALTERMKKLEGKKYDEIVELGLLDDADMPTPPDAYVGAIRPDDFSPWQLLTYLFVHENAFHLIANMLYLFVFGNAINAKLGQLPYLAAYFVIGALSGGAWLLFNDGRPCLGASGAIMGLLGIFLVLYPRNDVHLLWLRQGQFKTSDWDIQIPAYAVILSYILLALISVIYARNSPIAHVVHLTGALLGIALATTLLTLGKLKPAKYEENLLQVLGLKKKRPRYEEELQRFKREMREGKK